MRYITMRRRDTKQIVRTAYINSNEVIRGLTRIRLTVTLIALLTNRPTPPPPRPDVRGELSFCDGLTYNNIICILNALCLQ